jgi:Flp pilus assembly pilin Flp
MIGMVRAFVVTYIQTAFGKLRGERGQDLIEYALLSGLIAAAIIAVGVLGYEGALNSMAAGISDCVDFKKSTTCNPF